MGPLPALPERSKIAEQKARSKRKQRAKKRDKLAQIKLDKGCSLCGYKEHPAALDFDHINPEDKSHLISLMVSQDKPWAVIEAEVDKCRVLCANCHRIHSYENHTARVGPDGTRGATPTY